MQVTHRECGASPVLSRQVAVRCPMWNFAAATMHSQLWNHRTANQVGTAHLARNANNTARRIIRAAIARIEFGFATFAKIPYPDPEMRELMTLLDEFQVTTQRNDLTSAIRHNFRQENLQTSKTPKLTMSKSINPAKLHADRLTTSAGNPIADNHNSLSAAAGRCRTFALAELCNAALSTVKIYAFGPLRRRKPLTPDCPSLSERS
jgi:hypothetical protein